MRKEWKSLQLKDACTVFTDGDWIESRHQSEIGIRLVQTGNIGFGFFKNKEDKSRFISEETFKELKCTEIIPGDLLISRLPDPVGKSCIIPDLNIRMITGVDCTIVRLKDNLMSEFLAFYQMSNQYLNDVKAKVTGTTRSRISRKNLGLIPIPIPPLTEQKQIVEILDQAFEAIDQAKANIEKNIVNANELFQSKLNEIFSQTGEGWVERKLEDISIEFGRGKSKNRPRNEPKLFGGKYPFIQTGDVRNTEKILETYTQTYNEVGLAQSKLWPKGTICITIAANIAETAILDFDSCFPDSIIGIVVDEEKADTNYVYYSIQFLKKKLQELGKGSAQDNINLGTFQKQLFPFPNLKLQKKYVSLLDTLSEQTYQLKVDYNQKLTSLEELKKSILEKAFSGELTN